MIIIVYRHKAWVFIGPPFTTETTLTRTHVDSLVDTLVHAAKETRGHKES
jgi:hypothetical protein